MKHLFLINPAAGSFDRTLSYTSDIQRYCIPRGLDFEIVVSQYPGHITEVTRKAAESGEEYRIYACGGDGTLNEAAAGAAGFSNVAVTVFSGGSGNDFVKLFSDPSAFYDLGKLLTAKEITFDMIDCNGSLSLNICSVGLDARIGTDVGKYKRFPLLSGFRAYCASAVINVIRGIAEEYSIEIDGEVIDGEKTLVCVCNGQYYGGGFHPVPEADPTDGLLDVLVVEKVSRLQVPGVIGTYMKGSYKKLPKLVRHFRTKKIVIHCKKDTPINLDGELRTGKDITMQVSSKKLRFFYPKCTELACSGAEIS